MRPWALVFTAGLMGILPDADTAYWGLVAYGDFLGHRGFWHSPFFLIMLGLSLAVLLALLIKHVTWRTATLVGLVWSAAAVSHPILDALTNGGLGVMMFYPFDESRFFFAWRPIQVAPIGVYRTLEGIWRIFPSELPLCLGAMTLGCVGYWLVGKKKV